MWAAPKWPRHSGRRNLSTVPRRLQRLDHCANRRYCAKQNALGVNPNIIFAYWHKRHVRLRPANADKRLGTLIDHITAKQPNALLVVSNIIPLAILATAEVPKYNAKIPAVLNPRIQAGKNIIFVDQYTGFPPANYKIRFTPTAPVMRVWRINGMRLLSLLIDINNMTP